MSPPAEARPSVRVDRHGSHLPWLDGLRGLAVVMVMLFHFTQNDFFQGGYIGVDVFFVLSGYLITALLLGEMDGMGSVDLASFYVRRALRLLPALAVVAVAALVLVELPGLSPDRMQTLRGLPFVALYVGNWVSSFDGHNALGLLSHTWSLAVEEQYYLVWPVVLLVSLRRWDRQPVYRALAALVAAVWVSRTFMILTGAGWAHVYFSGAEHSDGLLAGSALALWMTVRPPVLPAQSKGPRRYAAPLALGLLVGLSITGHNTFSAAWTAYVPIAVAATTALIWFGIQDPQSPVFLTLASKPAVWVGRRSYGLYLWHVPVYMTLRRELGGSPWRVGAIGILIAFAVESVCYDRIEQPALRLKARFSRASLQPAPRGNVTTPPPSGYDERVPLDTEA